MTKPSTPSSPPNPASGPAPPGASWPLPQPGDVLRYAYLWAHEEERGQEDASKDRPVVVVLATIVDQGMTRILVAPITHSEPSGRDHAIELPASVNRLIGLDHERSWIVVSELNRFVWPGPDLRPVPGGSDPYYGAIPDWLFQQLRDAISVLARHGTIKRVGRTE